MHNTRTPSLSWGVMTTRRLALRYFGLKRSFEFQRTTPPANKKCESVGRIFARCDVTVLRFTVRHFRPVSPIVCFRLPCNASITWLRSTALTSARGIDVHTNRYFRHLAKFHLVIVLLTYEKTRIFEYLGDVTIYSWQKPPLR